MFQVWTFGVLAAGLMVLGEKKADQEGLSANPFEEEAFVAGLQRRKEGEKALLDLRAKARNRIFLLEQRLKRRDISREEFQREMELLRSEVNLHAQQLIYNVSPEQANSREEYMKRYGCVKWSDSAIQAAVDNGPLIEIGAGNGQWYTELKKRKVDIVAFDNQSLLPMPQAEIDNFNKTETVVLKGDENSIKDHPGRTLLLVAPPPTDMARKCLDLYTGSTLIYVGEGRGGAHADESFFDELETDWKLVKTIDVEPFSECYERMFVLHRKEKNWWRRWFGRA